MKYLLKNGHVVCAATGIDKELDLLIENKRIVRLEKGIVDAKAKILNVSDCIIFPGFVDCHSHLREPGDEEKEDLYTGAKAALNGGYTRVVCMPNTDPSLSTPMLIKGIVEISRSIPYAKILPIGTLTKGRKGIEMSEMGLMRKAGAVAFSDDSSCVQDAHLMRSIMNYSAAYGWTLLLHEEDNSLSNGGHVHDGEVAFRTGLKGVPSSTENLMIARDLILSAETKARIHIQHISTKEAVAMIREAKLKGVRVTCEVTPHHLVFSEEDVFELDTNLKVNPPLRSKEDREELIEGIKDGIIDVVATDHAPHRRVDKEKEFSEAPFGVVGLETAVPLFFTRFVKTGLVSLHRFCELFSVGPLHILGMEIFTIKEGEIAQITIIDTAKTKKVDVENFYSKSKNSPFIGFEFQGWPKYVFVDGELRYVDGEFLQEHQGGKLE